MENQENNIQDTEMWKNWERSHRRGRVFGGLLLVGVGIVFLLRELGVEIPHWVLTWKMLLIVMGFFIGFKHSFRNMGWLVMVAVGGAFLVEELIPGVKISYIILPALVILAGLFMMFKPRRRFRERQYWAKKWHKHHGRGWEQYAGCEGQSSEDCLDSTAIFGSIKKNIISKDFKGGDVTSVFGGTEINLSQADINGSVILDITQVFGGTRLVVPAHWEVKSELTSVFGGVEDKRPVHKEIVTDASKVLVLKGTNFFGGIDIKSY